MADVTTAHEVKEQLHGTVIYPGHPPRRSTPEYERTHHQLCYEQDIPCFICGIRNSTLARIKAGLADGSMTEAQAAVLNPFGAKTLQTHHAIIQDSLADACDIETIKALLLDVTDTQPFSVLVRQQLAGVQTPEDLQRFVDSPANMLVVCDQHHILYGGIHSTSWNYFVIQKFLIPGYVLFDELGKPADAANYQTLDEHLQEAYEAAEAVIAPVSTGIPG